MLAGASVPLPCFKSPACAEIITINDDSSTPINAFDISIKKVVDQVKEMSPIVLDVSSYTEIDLNEPCGKKHGAKICGDCVELLKQQAGVHQKTQAD